MVEGFCSSGFANVRDAFERNFTERGEIGASLAIYRDGKLVVDLWGGVADTETSKPWSEDTMVAAFSATKGLSALCIHILIDRGLVSLDAPVCQYWPAFGQSGKEAITVGMVLAHQAGLPVFHDPLPDAGLTDWPMVITRLEHETPFWEPGTQSGYHAVTIGYVLGEIVRRITGKTIGRFLREEVAQPLDADIWIGLPATQHDRVATTYFDEPNPQSPFFQKIVDDPSSLACLLVMNSGNDHNATSVNSYQRRLAENPAAGGIMTAKGLARTYAPLALDGSIDGIRLVRPARLPDMRTVRSACGIDPVLNVATTFTYGFSKSWGDRRIGEGEFVVIGEHAFGTPGAGGSIGFADPEARLSFGYVMNKVGPGIGLNTRGQSLIDAAYRSLGYTDSDAGFWVR
ncbi:CubicO group peptidase, beta-lactamase class C family [Sphingobium sp. AP50]|uniref:serine hydrolase domain-containing protein n=1 Tax=Sphingobium sp. AP50 TaxID=1884369 RepID=UPI0008C5ADC2|nr:serine hydrolase domain-containing protein [Sphingobium sp. AP50]SEK05688.1 CubicO group peptidase, beta-lactamase class C family [Sphingobium sp. AP50]